ncbi:chloride conductance regulatory protein ICln isoform X1 [Capsicum annuum]|uniref:chloride conductance regulatory protein ICln isoform X1 n=1 Tax=Capsicum annuum TaxID=4072 RepID=UPI0007BF92EB|nr:chloride conductance regulatory protein ICln isoform X1 [Capsicum annuum]
MLGLRFVAERTGDGAGQPFVDADNGEELMHVQPGTTIVLGSRPPESPGTLYITTKQVVWLSDTDRSEGYAVDFLSVSLHAVSRDPEAYPDSCLYAQIDNGVEDDESEGSSDEGAESSDLSRITELRLVPTDPNQVDTLFQIFCECAELNPEPIEEEEEEHNWIFSADQLENQEAEEWMISENSTHSIGHSNGDQDLAHNVLQLQIDDRRFEDAEEMDSDSKNGHH